MRFNIFGKPIRNQCDGCQSGAPTRTDRRSGVTFHVDKHGLSFMVCQKAKYMPRTEAPAQIKVADNSHAQRKTAKRRVYPFSMSDAIMADMEKANEV